MLKLLALTFIVSNVAFSQGESNEAIEKLCREDAQHYGSKKHTGIRKIKEACLSHIKNTAEDKLHLKSEDGKLEVWAKYNIIIMQEQIGTEKAPKVAQRVISGVNSHLNLIEALSIAPDKKSLSVINNRTSLDELRQAMETQSEVAKTQPREILSFKTEYNGNVAPERIIRNEKINNADELYYHKNKGEIIVVNKNKTDLYSFSIFADYRAQVEKFVPNVLTELNSSEESFSHIASVDFMHKNLLVLDDKKSMIFAINEDKNQIEWIMDKETIGLENPATISYSAVDKKLIVWDKNGKKIEFDQSTSTEEEIEQNSEESERAPASN